MCGMMRSEEQKDDDENEDDDDDTKQKDKVKKNDERKNKEDQNEDNEKEEIILLCNSFKVTMKLYIIIHINYLFYVHHLIQVIHFLTYFFDIFLLGIKITSCPAKGKGRITIEDNTEKITAQRNIGK